MNRTSLNNNNKDRVRITTHSLCLATNSNPSITVLRSKRKGIERPWAHPRRRTLTIRRTEMAPVMPLLEASSYRVLLLPTAVGKAKEKAKTKERKEAGKAVEAKLPTRHNGLPLTQRLSTPRGLLTKSVRTLRKQFQHAGGV